MKAFALGEGVRWKHEDLGLCFCQYFLQLVDGEDYSDDTDFVFSFCEGVLPRFDASLDFVFEG